MSVAASRVSRATGVRLTVSMAVLMAVLQWYEMRRRETRVVVVRLKGRLGNQLFEVAGGEYFAQLVGVQDVRYLRNNYSQETDLSDGVLRQLRHYDGVEEACQGRKVVRWVERRYECTEVARGDLNGGGCLVVDGFLQCPGYAKWGREMVRGLLGGDEQRWGQAVRDMKEIRSRAGGRRVVAVHVRRGDYLKRFNRGLLEPLGSGYYERAKAVVEEKWGTDVVWAVFSDDVEWCRKEMGLVFGEHVEVVEQGDGVISLMMMSMADDFVIANSSFSWWAAFLRRRAGKGLVVAPAKWFGARVRKKIRIWEEGWVRV